MKVYLFVVGQCSYDEHEGLIDVFASLEAAQAGADAYLAERVRLKQEWQAKLRDGQAPVVEAPTPVLSLRWLQSTSAPEWTAWNPIDDRSELRIEERDLK